jgi:cobalamin biosynthesis Mg chelatase CobN
MALSITAGNGSADSQANTQSPQSNNQSIATGTKSSSVQPGTATALLSSQGGVTLYPTALPTINVNTATSTTATTTANNTPKHHVNPVLLGFPVLLVVVAVVLFWAMRRSVKNTTE